MIFYTFQFRDRFALDSIAEKLYLLEGIPDFPSRVFNLTCFFLFLKSFYCSEFKKAFETCVAFNPRDCFQLSEIALKSDQPVGHFMICLSFFLHAPNSFPLCVFNLSAVCMQWFLWSNRIQEIFTLVISIDYISTPTIQL